MLPGSELAPRTEGFRITLPLEPETAARARQVWSKPIDIEAQVVGSDALRQIVSFTEEQKVPGKPYQPPSISTDLRQLERVMQRNTVSKVESWADEVLDRKMREVSANPFFDPEFLAAATVKGAILVKRGVVNFADWANEMRKQFGRGMDEKLPDLFNQAMLTYGPKDNKGFQVPPGKTPTGIKTGTTQEPALPQKPSEQLGEQVPTKEPLGDVNKPAPATPERAPQTAAPAAAAVSEAKSPGVAAPEVPPAISKTIPQGENIQTPDLFTPQALETPASQTLGIKPQSGSVSGMIGALKSAWRKYGTAQGHLPDEVYSLKKELDATQNATQHSLKVGEKALMDALADTYGLSAIDLAGGGSRKIPVAAVQAMDSYLKGGPGNAIPPRIRSVLDVMRAEIDGASQKVIDTLTAQAGKHPQGSPKHKAITDLIDKIRGNLDVYVHRSYKYFDSSKKAEQWYSDLPHGVRTSAEDYLMTNSPIPLTRDQAISTLEGWLSDLKDQGSFGSATLGSKNLSIFMRRKVIAPEIRAVLGEYRSPLVNYAKSVAKASDWVARQRFLNEVRQKGMGRFLFEDDAAPPGFPAKIAGETSDTMSPLNGLRTTHEIADAFREFNAQPEYGNLAHTYLMMNAWTKTMATVHSIMTQARNLGSRPLMAGMAGHWQVGKLGRSVRAVLDDFNAKDSPYVQKLYKIGILGDTARWGELQAIIKDAALQDVAPTDLYSWSLTKAVKKYGYDIPVEAYRLSDELGNVFAFENELAIQSKIHPKWSAAELETHAAKIVRRLYPFYSETPKFVQSFRKLPFGPFVTFQYQMLRNTWNGIGQSMHEIRSAIPAERAVGYKRLASQAATLTAMWALQEAGKYVLGISSQQEEDFRRFQPPWSKNSKFLFVAKDPESGELTALNLSFLDPYSGITDPVMAIASAMRLDKDPFETFADAMKESVRPWMSEQMLANALIEARNGRTDEGREIVNQTDEPMDAFQKRVGHVLKVFEPGTVQRVQRRLLPAIRNEQPTFGRKLEVGPEIARELTGFAVEKFNFKTGLAFRSRDFVKNDQAAESVFHKTISRTQTTTQDDLLAAYKEADNRRFKIWQEFRKDFMAAVRNGVPLVDAQKTMLARGVTKADVAAISSGIYMPMSISQKSMAFAKERNRELPIDALVQYMTTVKGTSLDETQR